MRPVLLSLAMSLMATTALAQSTAAPHAARPVAGGRPRRRRASGAGGGQRDRSHGLRRLREREEPQGPDRRPRYETFRQQAFDILSATDRIAAPSFLGDGIGNFWQDATNPKGLWRRTTLASYRSATPEWETLIDIDALSKAEGKDWVWKGADCLPPDETRCLISLSDGGKDAVVVREFDTTTKAFVEGGFSCPRASTASNGWTGTRFWSPPTSARAP
jgi:hypothetical protein